MPYHQFVIKISQACIFDVFIWIVCHHHQTNKSIFLLMGKSSWDPQNTNTMHYKCCYASINMLTKRDLFFCHWIFVTIQKTFGTRSALYTSYELFPTPIKKNLGSASSFLFLFKVYIFLWQSKKRNKSICMYSWLHIHLPTHLLSILTTN